VRLSILFFLATCLCASFPAFAVGKLQLDLRNNNFSSQQATILKALDGDADYAEITMNDKQLVVNSLSEIEARLPGDTRLEQLNDSDRLLVISNQQKINDALSRAAKDSRLVCTKEHVLGSNLTKRVCQTYAARKLARERLQDTLAGKESNIQTSVEIK
jgi:hypothetical protein